MTTLKRIVQPIKKTDKKSKNILYIIFINAMQNVNNNNNNVSLQEICIYLYIFFSFSTKKAQKVSFTQAFTFTL